MEFFGLLLMGLGGLLGYGGITGRSPVAMLSAVASSSAFPAKGSWYDLSAGPLEVLYKFPEKADPAAAALGSDLTNGAQDLSSAQASVVNYAIAQLGDAYVWDTAGPKTFDCSGLSLAAYRTVGITLPHLASAQERMGHAVSLAEAQPSDLIFWGPVSGHVAIYIGNGQVIHAPHTGDVVKKSSLWDQKDIRVRRFLDVKHPTNVPGA